MLPPFFARISGFRTLFRRKTVKYRGETGNTICCIFVKCSIIVTITIEYRYDIKKESIRDAGTGCLSGRGVVPAFTARGFLSGIRS